MHDVETAMFHYHEISTGIYVTSIMVLERRIFLQKEGRYSEHILYRSFTTSLTATRFTLPNSTYEGESQALRVPYPFTFSRMAIELTSI